MDSSEIADDLDQLRNEVISEAVKLFGGDETAATAWLNKPLSALGGEVPINIMGSAEGLREIRNIIGRLRHGVFM